MGFRARKSFSIAKGVRVNVSKSGVGMSVGGRGARYSVHSSGRRTTTAGTPVRTRSTRRLRVPASVALALLVGFAVAACQPVPPPGPTPLVSTTPALFPPFQTGVVDYVNRCDPTTPTSVQVNAPEGTTVSVDGAAPQSGSFTVQVAQDVGKRFTIDVTTGGTTTNHHVRCLPSDFPRWSAAKSGETQAAFYATALMQPFTGGPTYSAIFDTNGVPVWWLNDQPTTLFTPLPNGNFAIVERETGPGGMEEYNLNGDLVRTLNTVGAPADSHDVIVLPNGNYVMATLQQQPCVLSSWGISGVKSCLNHVFQELTPAGVPVWTWDTSLHIPVDETTQPWRDDHADNPFLPPGVYDPWHYNSVEYTGDGFLMSFRHLDAIYKVNQATGLIEWKLGGTARAESLTLVDDPFNGLSGQHDARLLGDGTVTLHDNGGNGPGPDRQPRAVRYAIDSTAKTATLIQDVRDAGVTSSFCCGSARRLPSGNWVMGWGGTPQITENKPDGSRVFSLSGTFVYRGLPLLPGQFTVEQFRAGMDIQYGT